MRILILSCNTGEGHNSCAKALKEVFDANGHFCVIEDSLRYNSAFSSKAISYGHVFIYRHLPFLFRGGYKYAEDHGSIYQKGTLLYKFFALGRKKLAAYLDKNSFDAVICTHAFAAITLTEAAKICNTKFYSAFVATDYTCNPFTEASDLDVYFVPDQSIIKAHADRGIPENKIVASGIPVRQMFYSNISKDEAKLAEGIDPSHTHLLIMSGSMGCGPIKGIVKQLSKEISEGEEITVVCGTNKRSYRVLRRRYKTNDRIHIKGYVSEMSRLMDSADLYLTKPGGISVAEAKAKKLPMLFVNVVGGCEEHNRQFFEDIGSAESERDVKKLSQMCISLLRDKEKTARMRSAHDVLDQKNVSQYICEYLCGKPKPTNNRKEKIRF